MSLRQVLSDLGASVLDIANTRLELLSLEAAQARQLLFRLAGLAAAAALCLFMALLVASLGLVLYFWPTEYRNLALALLALGYAVIGVALIWRLRVILLHGAAPFEATCEVLKADAQSLRAPHRPPQPEPDPDPDPVPDLPEPRHEGI